MDLLARLLESSSTLLALRVDAEGRVAETNPTLSRAVGAGRDALEGLSADGLVDPKHRRKLHRWLDGLEVPHGPVEFVLRTASGDPLPLQVLVQRIPGGLWLVGERRALPADEATEELTRMNNELAALARERARRERELERMERRTREALEDLRSSYWHLRKIQEVLSFCMGCGRVQAEKGSWRTFVDFLRENDILVSHAYCPTCEEQYMSEQGLTTGPSTRNESGNAGVAGSEET